MAEALESLDELTAVSGEDPTSLPPDPGSAHDPLEGTTVGPGGRYKLLQRIGEGGFGTVYMAEQTSPVRRRVAVKILKAGMDTRQVVARFEAERQALALMDHPNIARVLDGGETNHGRPFFVMELVRGTPITTFCDREKLDTRARLRLFTHVCRAVQHAHQKGIVHRDLKPTNVLVTVQDGAEPLPKVIDFGVAKALESPLTDKTLFTRFEQMVGTPAYMSPEQAGADAAATDIDTRADIYALGVLLYELLTGTTPIEAPTLHRAAFDEVRRLLRDQDAPRPSARLASIHLDRRQTIAQNRAADSHALTRQLQGDLDWIVMKAIEKDRRRRYDTANGLAADVERFLHDDPIEARPPSATYRLQKLARRHKTALAAAAAMAVLLLAGIAASTWQAVRASRERDRANEAEALARQRLHEAQAVTDFVTGMFEKSRPGEAGGGRNVTVAKVLKTAEKDLDANTEVPPERRSILQTTIGRVYRSLGLYNDAIALQEGIVRYYQKTHGPEHLDTIMAMYDLAYSCAALGGREEEALALFEKIYPLRRQILGLEHPDTLLAMRRLADSYASAMRYTEALAMREENHALSRKVFGLEHLETTKTMANLALSYLTVGRQKEAVALQEEVLALRRKLLGPKNPETLKAVSWLATAYMIIGRVDDGLAMQEESLSLCQELLGPQHPDTHRAMYDLGYSLFWLGHRDRGLTLTEDALALRREVLGDDHHVTLASMCNLSRMYVALGRYEEALDLCKRPLALYRNSHDTELAIRAPAARTALLDALLERGETKKVEELIGVAPFAENSPAAVAVLITPDSEWRWLHPADGVDPSTMDPDFHATFFAPDFDDSGWSTGKDSEDPAGGFGYGDEGFTGVHIGKPENGSTGRTAFFRHRFTTDREVSHLELRCRRVDGIIVYIDGREVIRNNVGEGPVAYDLPATWAVSDLEETTVFRFPLKDFVLPAGDHVLAISLHNTGVPSSDLSIGSISLVEVNQGKAE
jgi:serine/threonine protein kinase